jgi:NhaP-type Na+/H+ or K+/H+ antiporter
MTDPYSLLTLGILFSVGLCADQIRSDQIGRRTRIPRVTLLLICGLIARISGLLPDGMAALTDTVTVIALTLVALLLGGSLKVETLKAHGAAMLSISVAVVAVTLVLVTGGLVLLGVDIALALAGIATATDLAATKDVLTQSGVNNRFTRIVEGIVAIDDAWGLPAAVSSGADRGR